MPLTLRAHGSSSSVAIVPSRGALITGWHVGGRERLYLDPTTLADPTKNVRGGIPLLFPSPGKLENGEFTRAGKRGAMKQHGFARDLPWTVTAQTEASVALSLSSSEATLKVFPWDFAISLEVVVSDLHLRLAVRIDNTGNAPLPCGFGIHPYFAVTDKAHAKITTGATRVWNNVTGAFAPFQGFHLGEGETDLHLLDHGSTESMLSSDGGHVTVRTSPEFGRWVVWTLPGKEFVCLEPWTTPGNGLNTGEGLLTIAAGEARELWIELEGG
jgi:galactose mutarotase-like enzyme